METFAEKGDEVSVGNPLFSLSPREKEASPVISLPPSDKPSIEKKAETAVTPVRAVESKPIPVVEKQSKPIPVVEKPPAPARPAPIASPAVSGERSETRVKMTRMRQRIAQRLKEAQNTAAMLTTFQEVDMGPLIDLRNTHKEEFEKIHGVKLGFMSAFVRVTSEFYCVSTTVSMSIAFFMFFLLGINGHFAGNTCCKCCDR